MGRHADHYELVDLRLANQLAGVLWMSAAAYVLVLAVVGPAARGPGWAVIGGCTGVGFAVGVLRFARGASSPAALLVAAYAAIALIAVVMTVPRDPGPYANLLFLAVGYCAFLHPLSRLIGILVAASLAALVPLTLELTEVAHAQAAGQVILLNGMAAMVFAASHRARELRREVVRQRTRAEGLARVDALTGLGNRRALDEVLAAQREVVARTARPLSVLVADLDRFKAINDTAGHQEGDRVLVQVADALRDTVRVPDACFRWGGDEFVVVLADTAHEDAAAVGDRLRTAVRARVAGADGTPLVLSLGVAELGPGEAGPDLLARADAELVRVKAEGRGVAA